MTDRKKVINGLQCHVNGHPHTRCHKCPYWGTGPHGSSECNVLAADALALLKAQEPVKPERSGRNLTWYYCCGACGQPIDPGDPYCRKCGRKVKWDD